MCSVTAGLMALQTVSSISAAQQQAKAQQQYYDNQAKIADQNAAIQKNKASQQADQYAQKQVQLTNQWKAAAGQRRAAMGGSGLVGDAGSAADLNAASNAALKQDSTNLLNNQKNDIWSTYVNQVDYENQAKNSRYYGDQAIKQGNMKAFTTLLSGAASIYGMGSKGAGEAGTTGSTNTYSNWGYNDLKRIGGATNKFTTSTYLRGTTGNYGFGRG